MTNKKANKIQNYGLKLAYNYYKNNIKYFKMSSIDWKDIEQKIIFKVYKAEKVYEKKYINETKVYLEKHIKTLVYNYLRNLLRDNNKKCFLNLVLSKEEKAFRLKKKGWSIVKIAKKFNVSKNDITNWLQKMLDKEEDNKNNLIINQMICISQEELENLTIRKSETNIEKLIFNDFIEQLFLKFTNNERELNIMKMKILGNYTFKEIGEQLNLSRGRVQKLYKSIIRLIRDKKLEVMNGF